ncbi:MAG: DUF4333 domain-containing protein [Thermoleophilaceae bacterium]|nr:DUF4333 domain-containing protein [Thermoleophilaceae bacterium]
MRPLFVLAAVAALALAGCASTLDSADAEKQISSSLEKQTRQKPKKVDCPEDIDAKKGTKFDCTVTAQDGSTIRVNAATTDDDGKFTYEVDPESLKQPSD